MKCDPKILSLVGIQSKGGTIEDGNHLRSFVSKDQGFAKDQIRYFRRDHHEKISHLYFFQIPIEKTEMIQISEESEDETEIPLEIETNNPAVTLHAVFKISSNTITYKIKFPSLIGYLEIKANRSPVFFPSTKGTKKWIDFVQGSFIITDTASKLKTSKHVKQKFKKIKIRTPCEENLKKETYLCPTTRFRSHAIELLVINRYIDEEVDFYTLSEDYMDTIISMNDQLNMWQQDPKDTNKWILNRADGIKEMITDFEAAIKPIQDTILKKR